MRIRHGAREHVRDANTRNLCMVEYVPCPNRLLFAAAFLLQSLLCARVRKCVRVVVRHNLARRDVTRRHELLQQGMDVTVPVRP